MAGLVLERGIERRSRGVGRIYVLRAHCWLPLRSPDVGRLARSPENPKGPRETARRGGRLRDKDGLIRAGAG